MAVLVVCGVDEHGQRDILAIEPMLEESEESYLQLFRGLQERGLCTPRLVVSDAHAGLVAAIRKGFPGASWQRCKVHFMRNILAHIPHKDKDTFAQNLKNHLAGPHQRAGRQTGRRNLQTVRAPFSQSHPLPGRRLGGFAGVLCFPSVGCKKDFLHQCAGTSEPGDPPPYGCGRNLPQRRCLHQTGDHISHGICGGLVCLRAYLSEQSVQAILLPAA